MAKNADLTAEQVEIQLVIDRLGGVSKAAIALDIKPASICGWRNRGEIPKPRRMYMQVAMPDVLVGTRWEKKSESQEA